MGAGFPRGRARRIAGGAARSLLYSSLDTAIISGSELNSRDFEFLFSEIKQYEPKILRLIMKGNFPDNISIQIPNIVNYQNMSGYKHYLFNPMRVLPQNLPFIINNPEFGNTDSQTNNEIRQSFITTKTDENAFFVPIIFLTQAVNFEYANFR